jgi:hypothetical protein
LKFLPDDDGCDDGCCVWFEGLGGRGGLENCPLGDLKLFFIAVNIPQFCFYNIF